MDYFSLSFKSVKEYGVTTRAISCTRLEVIHRRFHAWRDREQRPIYCGPDCISKRGDVWTNRFPRSAVTFYTTQSAFDTAEPGLPVETFTNANLSGQSLATQSSPLSSATNDATFASGSILPGLTISTLNPGLVSNALSAYGGGPAGSKSVGTTWYGDTLILGFSSGVTAIGANVFAINPPGSTLAGSFTADVYNGTTRIGSANFSETAGSFGFIGASSATPITGVRLLYTTDDDMTIASNVAFSPTPEPSNLALFGVAAIILLWRRRILAD